MTRRCERYASRALAGVRRLVSAPAACARERTVEGRALEDCEAELSNASPIVRDRAVAGVFQSGAPALPALVRAIGAARPPRPIERR